MLSQRSQKMFNVNVSHLVSTENITLLVTIRILSVASDGLYPLLDLRADLGPECVGKPPIDIGTGKGWEIIDNPVS